MNETTIKIPKFRNARRALDWLKKNRYNENAPRRLPEDREEVFFNGKTDPVQLSHIVVSYSSFVGRRLSPRFEELIVQSHQALFQYIRLHWDNDEGDPELLNNLKGDSRFLYHYATWKNRRLPKHLEDSIEEPHYALKYAKEVIRGRLPEHLEKVFFKSAEHASEYAFEVIRGFSPIKLPDDLHAFMVMKSFEQPNDRSIKDYMEACEDDPNKEGNHSAD